MSTPGWRPLLALGVAMAGLTAGLSALARALAPGAGEAVVGTGHFAIAIAVYAAAGVLAVRQGVAPWRAGLLVAGLDAVIGHGSAFLLAPPTADPAAYAASLGRLPRPDEIAGLQAMAAATGAGGTLLLGVAAAWLAGWVVRRRRRRRAAR
jgi:hypothetical protein